MAFCIKCGEALPPGVSFCIKCGEKVRPIPTAPKTTFTAPAEEVVEVPKTTDTTERKTVYEGSMHKCPECGQPLESFCARCPACGHEVRDSGSAATVAVFSAKLERARDDGEKMLLIKSFPIPNTKEDITEFMILAYTNFDSDFHVANLHRDDISDAWLVKMEQCFIKAGMLFAPTDPAYVAIKNMYDKVHTDIESSKDARKVKKYKFSLGRLFTVVGCCFAGFLTLGSCLTGAWLSALWSALMLGGLIVSDLIGKGAIKLENKVARKLIFWGSILMIIPWAICLP
ncbi:MAG: zinc ribbon domain-containing protein [Clostridia bacterium]|nr:zinc ribbon domain-containing protein [Clostridia bacterium]